MCGSMARVARHHGVRVAGCEPTRTRGRSLGVLARSPQTRIFLDAAYADGKESDHAALDLGAYLDISLKPIKRKLQTLDSQRSRYFWARIGYDRVYKVTGRTGAEVTEIGASCPSMEGASAR